MQRRDLASIELLLRTLQSNEATASRRNAMTLENKKLGLELARIRQEGKRQDAQLRMQEMEAGLRAKQIEADVHLRSEDMKLRRAESEFRAQTSAAQLHMQMKSHEFQVLQAVISARGHVDEVNHRKFMRSLALTSQLTQAYPTLAAMHQTAVEQENALDDKIRLLFIDEEDGKMRSEYEGLRDAWKDGPGRKDFTDEQIANTWVAEVKETYTFMAEKKAEAQGLPGIDKLTAKDQRLLVKDAIREAFMGGQFVEHGILAAAAESKMWDKAQRKRKEFYDAAVKEKGLTPQQVAALSDSQKEALGADAYNEWLLSSIKIGGGSNFFDFQKSSHGNMDVTTRAFMNMEAVVTPAMVGTLPSVLLASSQRVKAESILADVTNTVRMELGSTVNGLAESLTGARPLDLDTIVSDTQNVLDGGSLVDVLDGIGGSMGEEIGGTLKRLESVSGFNLGQGTGLSGPPKLSPPRVPDISGYAPDPSGAIPTPDRQPDQVPVDTSSRELYGGPDLSGYMSNPERR